MKYNVLICIMGFVVGYGAYPFPDLSPVLFGGIPTVLIALAVRYSIDGSPPVQRFMLGSLFTITLTFAPASTMTAWSVWMGGRHDPNIDAYWAWMISNMLFVFIAYAACVSFAIWSVPLIRIARGQPTWLYLVGVALPVAGCYTLILSGLLNWVITTWLEESVTAYVAIGFAAYSAGIMLSFYILTIWRSANNGLLSTRLSRASEA